MLPTHLRYAIIRVMRIPKNLGWYIYFIIITSTFLGNLLALLIPDGDLYTYYHILIKFSVYYEVLYTFAILHTVVSILSLWPAFMAVTRSYSTHYYAWGIVFAIRVVTAMMAFSYEYLYLKSALKGEFLWAAYAAIFLFVVTPLPTYLLHLKYVFRLPRKA